MNSSLNANTPLKTILFDSTHSLHWDFRITQKNEIKIRKPLKMWMFIYDMDHWITSLRYMIIVWGPKNKFSYLVIYNDFVAM